MSIDERPGEDRDEGDRRRDTRALASFGVAALLLFAAAAAALPSAIRSRKAPDPSREALKKLQDLRDEDRKILSSYDLSKTPVRIPIERAMDLIADEAARSSGKGGTRP